MRHDVVQLPGDLRPLIGQRPLDLLGLLRRGGCRLLRGPLGLLGGVHPAGPGVLPGQPAEQHHGHAGDGAHDYLVAASDDGGGQDRAGHEADDDQRGPAGGDGGDGVQGHGDIDDRPSSCPQVQGRQRDGEDERQRGAGKPPPERRGHGGHGVRHPAAGVPCGSRCPGRPVRYEKSEGDGDQHDRDHVYGHQLGFGEAVGGQAAEQGQIPVGARSRGTHGPDGSAGSGSRHAPGG